MVQLVLNTEIQETDNETTFNKNTSHFVTLKVQKNTHKPQLNNTWHNTSHNSVKPF